MRAFTLVAILCLSSLAISGCLSGSDDDPAGGAWTGSLHGAGHPYPDGDEWPFVDGAPLAGPFEIAGAQEIQVTMSDGIVLDGWVVLPELPAGVAAPTVLWTAPYFGQCSYFPNVADPADYPVCSYNVGDDPELWNADYPSEAVPVQFLVENGYAVAIVNVRGSGNSGGCFEWFGPNEQRDQAELVDWVAEQDWSNGHVGMMGLSYHGTTPWEAAIQNPEALKTIVVAGMVSDAYTFSTTPQGAYFQILGAFHAQFVLRVSWSPPINAPLEHWTTEHLGVTPDRICPEVLGGMQGALFEPYVDDRNGPYWEDRRLIDDFPGITSSVFLTHGFLDLHGSGHQQQENAVWDIMPDTPKRMLEGQWGHQMPKPGDGSMSQEAWHAELLPWLDYWLKGIGAEPPREGIVDYEDNLGGWHESTGWPPREAAHEVLFLTNSGAATEPGPTGPSFRSMQNLGGAEAVLCGAQHFLPTDGVMQAAAGASGVAYLSQPVSQHTLVAGNPMAYVQVESDEPGGLVGLHLYAVPGTDVDMCPGGGGGAAEARLLAAGVADLRFHDGVYVGHDFPTGTPTPVRIDISNLAEWIPAGDRLAIVASHGNLIDRVSQVQYNPMITLHGGNGADASHVVLPIVEGGFGGNVPTLEYPPRPFVPVLP